MPRPYVWIVISGLTLFSCFAHANIRAPFESEPESSQALKSVSEDLVVEYENLSFDLGTPYSGDIREVQHLKRTAKVEAEYAVQSPREATYLFEFIMPQPNTATVSINGAPVVANAPELLPRDDKKRAYQDSWKVTFTGSLQQGLNTIRLSYQETMGASEQKHGYFIDSKWMSFVEYELWPLKEWKLGPDFHINVQTSVDDDTFVLIRPFASRHTVKTLALLPKATADFIYWEEHEIGVEQLERANGKIRQRVVLGRQFPDRLKVFSAEFVRYHYPPYVPQ